MAPIRITFLITELDDGGAERALVRIVTALDPRVWRCHVICLSGPGPLVEPLKTAGIPVTTLGIGTASTWTGSALLRLVHELRTHRPVVLQTFLFHANLAGRFAARVAGVPCVLSGIRVADRRSLWRLRADRWTEFLVTKHVCVSDAVGRFSSQQSGLSSSKLVVIPNGVDVARFQNAKAADLTEFGIPDGAEVVLSVGRLDPQKDPLTLLRAFERVAAVRPHAELLFVGAGPLEAELRSAVALMGCGRRIHFAGRQLHVAEIMRGSTVFALASQWEGMPNVILEAGAAGLPIVSTKAEGVTELIQHEHSGRLVEIGDDAALSEALIAALADRDAARRMAETLLDRITRDFSWEQVVADYETLWMKEISGLGARRPPGRY